MRPINATTKEKRDLRRLLLSMRDAVFTVSPNLKPGNDRVNNKTDPCDPCGYAEKTYKQYRGIFSPTTPATHGPVCWNSNQIIQIYLCFLPEIPVKYYAIPDVQIYLNKMWSSGVERLFHYFKSYIFKVFSWFTFFQVFVFVLNCWPILCPKFRQTNCCRLFTRATFYICHPFERNSGLKALSILPCRFERVANHPVDGGSWTSSPPR